jgi:ABC-type multidrug transport system fused ATPase/permease subunit
VLFQAPADPVPAAPIAYDTTTTPARFAWRVIGGARRYTLPAAALLIVNQIGGALVPVIAGATIDRALATGAADQLLLWLAVLAADFLVFSLALRFGSRMATFGMEVVQHRLRTQVTDRLLHPAGTTSRQVDGTALSVASTDVSQLASGMRLGVYPVGELVAVLFCGVALWVIAWPLGLAVLLGAPLLLWGTAPAGRPFQRRSRAQQAAVARATGQAADLVAGYRVLKGVRAEPVALDRYERVSDQALQAALRARFTGSVYMGAMNTVVGLFVAGLSVGVAVLALEGWISVGEVIAAVGLTQFLVGPLNSLPASVGAIWAVCLASGGRVLELLTAPHANDDTGGGEPTGRRRPAGVPRLRVELPGGDDVCVTPGECLGVRADAPATRTLLGLLTDGRAAGGRVLLDDEPAASMPVEAYRALVLTAPHASDVFDGTIAENLDVPGADGHRVPGALHAAACDDILETLADGIDTSIGEGGSRLSGGQRQRVALARAFAADPPVLVLHDPTTAVDPVTEAAIAGRLRGIRADRSTLVVTSSPALLAVCDRVVDLRGRPAVSGETVVR